MSHTNCGDWSSGRSNILSSVTTADTIEVVARMPWYAAAPRGCLHTFFLERMDATCWCLNFIFYLIGDSFETYLLGWACPTWKFGSLE